LADMTSQPRRPVLKPLDWPMLLLKAV
jgi:hypothetical protein